MTSGSRFSLSFRGSGAKCPEVGGSSLIYMGVPFQVFRPQPLKRHVSAENLTISWLLTSVDLWSDIIAMEWPDHFHNLLLCHLPCITHEVLCLTEFIISVTLHLVGLSMVTADADSPPSHLCDGLTDCQNGIRASIGNYGTLVISSF